jgi:GTP cyclohydrolase II
LNNLELKKQVVAKLPTFWGNFNIIAYADSIDKEMPHVVLLHEDADLSQALYLRIHSECITGDVFGSKRCDCGEQLEKSLQIIGHQKGMLIYLRQEGRGIGLINKLKAYNIQDLGADTIEANLELGFAPDERMYDDAIAILRDLEIESILLLTNNPDKLKAFEGTGINVVERVPLMIPAVPENEAYLMTKAKSMGHLLEEKMILQHQF